MKIYLLLQKLLLALTLARCVDLERQCCYLTGEEVGQSPRCCEFIPAISGILDCLAYKQDGQGCSQSSEIILKSVLPISGKLDLLGNQNSRESVIKTPTGSPSLQTTSNSLEQLQAQGLDSENRNSYSIQLIDTRSDLDSDASSIHSIHGESYPTCDHTVEFPIVGTPIRRSNQAQSKIMDEKEVEIGLKIQELEDKMDLFPAENIQVHLLPLVDSEVKEIRSFSGEILNLINVLGATYSDSLTQQRKEHWKAVKKKTIAVVNQYVQDVLKKVHEVQTAVVPMPTGNQNVPNAEQTAFEESSLALKRKELELQEKAIAAQEREKEDRRNEIAREAMRKKTTGIAKAKCKVDAIKEDCKSLSLEVDIEFLADLSDIEIGRCMRQIKDWEESLKKIKELKRNLADIVSTHGLTDEESKYEEVSVFVEKLTTDVKELVDAVREEDVTRELYTLDVSKNEKVSYPSFEGRDDEDFSKFKELMDRAFLQNRVAKIDKLEKLRDVLKGHAKKLVPFSLTGNIDDAWKTLDNAFGDSIKLMNKRKEALNKLGKMPSNTGKGGLKAKIEWFLQLEVIVQSISDLGNKNSRLSSEAFNPTTFSTIQRLFPSKECLELDDIKGDNDMEHMDKFLDKISKMREKAQRLQVIYDTPSSSTGSSGGQSQSNGSSRRNEHLPSLLVYNPPRRDEDCRVCQSLDSTGDTRNLYDNHFSNYITGCPRYIEMNIQERNDIVHKAKICKFCHDPTYVYSKTNHHECSVRKRKSKGKYTCLESKCFTHSWVCIAHKDINKNRLKEFQLEFSKKYRLNFGLVVLKQPSKIIKLPSTNPAPSPNAEIIPPLVDTSTDVSSSTSLKARIPSKTVSQEQAECKLKKKLSRAGINEDLHSIPKGSPVFMLGYTKGKTRPLLTLFDTGCGSVLFREGVPQNELSPAELRQAGPFLVNGVGDTPVKVNSEWMCSTSLVDSTRQVLEGWTVDKITATLPRISLTAAEADIKADDERNEELQSLSCSSSIGGDCDMLLGILYNRIFPTPVHTLSSGLCIYKLKMTPHDKRFTSVIGGPHKSFSMVNYFGGLSAFFANLTLELQKYSEFGPPNLPCLLMTKEDEAFAYKFKEWEIKDSNVDLDEFNDYDTNAEDVPIESGFNVMLCSNCEDDLPDTCLDTQVLGASNFDDMENVSTLKKLAQNEGISVDYRCHRCRQCCDCKRTFSTERISLREEAEDAMVYDSIMLDWDNKRILCSLPLRGPEEEFLTNNRQTALEILNKQCKKYFSDEDTQPIIVKAFEKLFQNNQLVLWSDLTDEEKKLIESKPVSHWIPWRVVFKPSLSTPCRPVMDASTNTKVSPDGKKGGRCLNDLTVKGRVATLNLIRMMIRFMTGRHACQGDLRSFYASIQLVKEQWNLQRILLRENMDPDGELLECVIICLIWGVKCVSALCEGAVMKIAEAIKDKNPELASFLMNDRFVDDIGSSKDEMSKIKELTSAADEVFAKLGLSCKGWSYSGENPPPEVAEEYNTVKIAGMIWYTKMDLLEIPLPQLHFSNRSRGRLVVGTKIYDGSINMDSFVPSQLTRRQIVSKYSSIYDPAGKLIPITTSLKLDVRLATEETSDWDDVVSTNLRAKWVNNFLRIEQMRGIRFNRAIMPPDAVSPKMNTITGADAATANITGCWGRFRLKSGRFSCQLILGRSLLASHNDTIPKRELEVLMMACNLSWIIRQSLDDWTESHIEIGDSTIAICWVLSTEKRLSIFHRNRVAQILRATEIGNIYHVASEENPCDVGTRPDNVSLEDIGPMSQWEKGHSWMNGEISEAVEKGILKPAKSLKLNDAEKDTFKEGLVFERTKEILTPGHVVSIASTLDENQEVQSAQKVYEASTSVVSKRVNAIQERLEFSQYLISPTKYSWVKVVRIHTIVFRFLKSFKCLKDRFQNRSSFRLQMFHAEATPEIITPIVTYKDGSEVKVRPVFNEVHFKAFFISLGYDEKPVDMFTTRLTHKDSRQINSPSFGCKNPGTNFKGSCKVVITDDDVSLALHHLFLRASNEVIQFNNQDFVRKMSVKSSDGILYSKSRILDVQRFEICGGLDENLFKSEAFGIKSKIPLVDRYSPLAYSIGHHIHEKLARHAGYERCLRDSLNHVFILKGLSLFREIGEDCVRCQKLRKRHLDVAMGPVGDEQLIVAPPFWVTMCDMFGPCKIYVPGHSMATRGRKEIDVKAWILVFICPTTKCCNLQVIEGKSADAIVDGINRMACEVGVPSFVLSDEDSSIIKVLKEAEIDVKNIDMLVHKERGIRFRICPVQGHNMHGAVEAKIKSVQECLEKSDIANLRLHALGLQSMAKLVENELNNLPLGYAYGRDENNSPLLKLIFPNLLRIGRMNNRALDGPIRMPDGPGELMKKVETAFSAYFRIWNSTMVPKLMKASKWYKSDEPIRENDIVYFQKHESALGSPWSIGMVDEVKKGRDGLVREAVIKYQNANENEPRFTNRAVRSLCKLMNIDDTTWLNDVAEAERLVEVLQKERHPMAEKSYLMEKVGQGLRFRLKATGGNNQISRQPDVKFDSQAKSARENVTSKPKTRFAKNCKICCCSSHHSLYFKHSTKDVKPDVASTDAPDVSYANWLDRSWLMDDQYLE